MLFHFHLFWKIFYAFCEKSYALLDAARTPNIVTHTKQHHPFDTILYHEYLVLHKNSVYSGIYSVMP